MFMFRLTHGRTPCTCCTFAVRRPYSPMKARCFFHDLTDREPNPYSITVKTGYNPASLQADGIKVYTIKKELHDVGIVTMNTPFGNPVPVYDMERTICDLIRSRSGIEMQTFQDALKQYAKRKDKDLRKLMRYAQMFRVEKLLRQYLEVLL